MGTLTGGLAHEVRSPLSALKTNIELIERAGCKLEGEAEKKFYRRVARIKEEVTNLQKTLTEFLQFAGPSGIHLMATDIPSYLQDLVEFLAPELEQSKVKLHMELDEHNYPVLMDRRQMRQVIQNLVFNARDAIGREGGNVWIRSHDAETQVMIEIEDDGPGIPHDILDKIYQPFFTTKPNGTGLGLGIASRIVYEHNGVIDILSPVKNDKGSRFTLIMPKEKLLERTGEEEA